MNGLTGSALKRNRRWWLLVGAAVTAVAVVGIGAAMWVKAGVQAHGLEHAALAGKPEQIAAALKEQPDDAGLWQLLGDAHAQARQYQEAERAYRRAVSLRPDDSDIWWMFGIMQVCRGNAAGVAEVQTRLDAVDKGSAAEFRRLAPAGCCAFGGCRTDQ